MHFEAHGFAPKQVDSFFDAKKWLTLRNKPYLPIPSGRLSLTSAWIVVLSSLFLAEAMTLCCQNLDIERITCALRQNMPLLFFQVFSGEAAGPDFAISGPTDFNVIDLHNASMTKMFFVFFTRINI